MQHSTLHIEARVEIKIGDWIGSMENVRTSPSLVPDKIVFVYVEDVDDAYKSAIARGATSLAAPTNREHAERSAKVQDTVGNTWRFYTFNKRAVSQLHYGGLV